MLLLSCSELSRGFDAGPLFEDLASSCSPASASAWSGPTASARRRSCASSPASTVPTPARSACTPAPASPCLRQQPDFAPGRTLFDEARTALDELLAAHDDMVRTAEALAQATDEIERKKPLADRYDRLNELLRHHDAYNVDHHVEAVLDGLGFRKEDYDRPVDTFSGGQQSRLMLAKLLLAAPDVMLLDEPSNHLDIDTTRWLEDYLVKQPEAMLIVSHDRYFLDRVVTQSLRDERRSRSSPIPATSRHTGGCGRSATSSS